MIWRSFLALLWLLFSGLTSFHLPLHWKYTVQCGWSGPVGWCIVLCTENLLVWFPVRGHIRLYPRMRVYKMYPAQLSFPFSWILINCNITNSRWGPQTSQMNLSWAVVILSEFQIAKGKWGRHYISLFVRG